MNNVPPSTIEHLSNEIFLMIFSYFFHPELCKAWTGLNFRIDCLVRSIRTCLHISRNSDLTKYADYMRNWGDMIISLGDYRDDFENEFDDYAIYIKPIDLRPFINLRKFTQKHITRKGFNQITLINLPYLERFHISNYDVGYSCRPIDSILFNQNQFPCLVSVTGVFIEDIDEKDTTTNSIIHHIGITTSHSSTSATALLKFINRFPNLVSLRCKVDQFTATSEPSSVLTKIHKMRLQVVDKDAFHQIEVLLKSSPVTRIYLEIGAMGYWHGYLEANALVRLAQILNTCQSLTHVDLRIWNVSDKINIEEIRQLSRWFVPLNINRDRTFRLGSLETCASQGLNGRYSWEPDFD